MRADLPVLAALSSRLYRCHGGGHAALRRPHDLLYLRQLAAHGVALPRKVAYAYKTVP